MGIDTLFDSFYSLKLLLLSWNGHEGVGLNVPTNSRPPIFMNATANVYTMGVYTFALFCDHIYVEI